jgi:integrase/recombinase XerD
MKLLQAVEDYVELKQSLGAVFSSEQKRLLSFARSVGDIPLEEITQEQCQNFSYGPRSATTTSANKHRLLKKFFLHFVGRGHLMKSPAEGPTRRAISSFEPYVYSQAELKRLFNRAEQLGDRFQFDGYTLRTLLLLLYATGLRIGEAIALRVCDVDLKKRFLSVWNTKFFKSRLVPFGRDLARRLKAYRDHRNCLDPHSPFFATVGGKRIRLSRVEHAFRRICVQAEIYRPDTDTYQPRIHDLRGTFAVHRLVAWYRQGVDVQQRLPFLATYLGHTSLAGTQRYLRMTPELLGEASRRFESYAAVGKEARR